MLLPLLFTMAATREIDLYVGTYTSPGGSRGVYRSRLDETTGALSAPELAAEVGNPSYVVLRGSRLYAVSEDAKGEVSAFAIGKGGSLRPLGAQPTGGSAPCHLSLDPKGRHLFVANYVGGALACFPVMGDGSLGPATSAPTNAGSGPNASRQEASHLHWIASDARSRFVYACDLGTDEVLQYAYDPEKGLLTRVGATKTAPGAGPRHLAFGRDGRFAYGNGELANTVTAYAVDGRTGAPTAIQTLSTLPEGATAPSHSAEIAVHPSGRWLVVSNRGQDSLASFGIGKDGRLTPVEIVPAEAKEPRGFAFTPDGRWLVVAGQNGDEVVARPFSADLGRLGGVASRITVSKPVCIGFRR